MSQATNTIFRGRWCDCDFLQNDQGHAVRHWIRSANESALHYYRRSQLHSALPLPVESALEIPKANDQSPLHLPTLQNQDSGLRLPHAPELGIWPPPPASESISGLQFPSMSKHLPRARLERFPLPPAESNSNTLGIDTPQRSKDVEMTQINGFRSVRTISDMDTASPCLQQEQDQEYQPIESLSDSNDTDYNAIEEPFNYQPGRLNEEDLLNDSNSDSEPEVIIPSYSYNHKESMWIILIIENCLC